MPDRPNTTEPRTRFGRDHPHLYAARHVVKGAGQVAIALIGLTFLLQLITLPDIDLPDADLPDLPWPHLELPGWVRAILQSKKFWLPILIGIFVANAELKRRRNKVTRDDDRA
jgi:hypothetical protein